MAVAILIKATWARVATAGHGEVASASIALGRDDEQISRAGQRRRYKQTAPPRHVLPCKADLS